MTADVRTLLTALREVLDQIDWAEILTVFWRAFSSVAPDFTESAVSLLDRVTGVVPVAE